jgi:hypothetical protein
MLLPICIRCLAKLASKRLKICALALPLWAVPFFSPAFADTYVYNGTCEHSYSKQGEPEVDLTKQLGKPISCDAITLSIMANGHVLIQFAQKKGPVTPLGFAGDHLDYDSNPNFVTVPLNRIYLQHTSAPGNPEVIDGIEGYCFLDGPMNLRALRGLSCAAKVELGTQRLVYHIEAHAFGLGELVPAAP